MRNIFIVVLILMCSVIFGQGVSYRIEALGSDMAGIITDHETDVLRNPAHIFDGNFLRVQRYYKSSERTSYYNGPVSSAFIVKNPFGLLVEGYGQYNKSKMNALLYNVSSEYAISSRLFWGINISSKPVGIDIGTSIRKIKNPYYSSISIRYYEIDHMKIGGLIGDEKHHEFTLSGYVIRIKNRYIGDMGSYSDSLIQMLPRITYLFTDELEMNKKYFHLFVDVGSVGTMEDILPLTLINFYATKVNAHLTGNLSAGWEDFIHEKVLIGYGIVNSSKILIKSDYNSYLYNLILPFAVEYRPTKYIYLRAGTASTGSLTIETPHSGLVAYLRSTFSYSLGMGIKYKKFSCDFVIPSTSIIYPDDWKIRACYDL